MAFAIITYVIILVVLTTALASAQSRCNSAQDRAQSNCAQAIQMASGAGPANTSGSLSQSADQQASALRSGANAMNAASQYCQDMRKRCKDICNDQQPQSNNEQREIGQLTCVGGNCDKNGRPTGPIVPCKEGSPNCSPLVVQIGERSLRMQSPDRGVWFDILGSNAPIPHAPVKISWPDKESLADNYFLTLPKKSALVLGIDELFGNNTIGPEAARPFAENGFEALKKQDGLLPDGSFDVRAQDGFIDEKDPVFAQLRLWRDENANGIAEYNELIGLDALQIQRIDLHYDPKFSETDTYGNSIRTKSVVEMADGSLRLIFDLWFVSAR